VIKGNQKTIILASSSFFCVLTNQIALKKSCDIQKNRFEAKLTTPKCHKNLFKILKEPQMSQSKSSQSPPKILSHS